MTPVVNVSVVSPPWLNSPAEFGATRPASCWKSEIPSAAMDACHCCAARCMRLKRKAVQWRGVRGSTTCYVHTDGHVFALRVSTPASSRRLRVFGGDALHKRLPSGSSPQSGIDVSNAGNHVFSGGDADGTTTGAVQMSRIKIGIRAIAV